MHPTDPSDIRRKALLAASSVTLAMWLPACADKPGGGDDDAATDADPASDTDSPADTDLLADTDPASGTDDPADTDLRADTDAPSDTDPTPDTGFVVDTTGPKPDCGVLGLGLGACCNALVDWCTVNVPPDTGSTDYSDCVYGPTFDGSTGCIPWGPPVPPAASLA